MQPFFVACLYVTTNFITFGYQNNCLNYNITISKPCTASWENMHPTEKGRFCDECAKTVIDFSGMSEEAVQEYFAAHWGEAVCGRFKHTQLQTITIYIPASGLNQYLPVWQKILVICLVIFGTTIFPFETALGNLPPQTEEPERPAKKISKKKKKKSKFRYDELCASRTNQAERNQMILGFTQVLEQMPGLVTKDTSNKNSHIDTTVTSTPNKQPVDKKQQPPATPLSSDALIPAAFTFRRKKKQQ